MTTTVSSATVNVNFEEFAGNTLQMIFSYKQSNGTVIDLSSHTARMQVRVAISDVSPVLSLTNSSGIALASTGNNLVVTISAAQTLTLGVGSWIYDIELTDSLGKVNTFCYGKIKLKQAVTR